MECVRVAAGLSLDQLPELRQSAQAHEFPAHRVHQEPWLPSRASIQMWQSRGCGLLECFCAFPSEGPAVRAGSGAVRAEVQQHCWVRPRCICCKGLLHLSLSKWEKDVHREKSCECLEYPGSVCQSHEPTDLCSIQGLPCAGNPWAPRKQLPTPFSMLKVLSAVWRLC